MRNKEARVPYDFTLTAVVPAAAREIYEAWLDSLAHSEMTGGQARMSDEIGAEVSAWDGYITGRNLELMPHQRIVQSWRTAEFTDDHGDSTITVTLEDDDGGTLLTLVHSNVPDGQTSYEQGGWQDYYFEPMAEYFSKRASTGKSVNAAPIPKRNRATTKAKAKSKHTVPKLKKTAVKKKAKRSRAKSRSRN
jgi:activator of HSP90 ATPase